MSKNKKYNLIILTIFGVSAVLYSILFQFIVGNIFPYQIFNGFILLLIITILVINFTNYAERSKFKIIKYYNSYKNYIISSLILGVILLNSLSLTDRHTLFYNRKGYLYTHITGEIIDISDFLKDNGKGTFDTFDSSISTQIGAMSGWYFLQDVHSFSQFILDNISIDEYNFTMIPIAEWYQGYFINTNFTSGRSLYYYLILEDCLSLNSLYTLKSYNLRYFITESESNEVILFGKTISSPFIDSLYIHVPVVMTTEHFIIWNVSTLYS